MPIENNRLGFIAAMNYKKSIVQYKKYGWLSGITKKETEEMAKEIQNFNQDELDKTLNMSETELRIFLQKKFPPQDQPKNNKDSKSESTVTEFFAHLIKPSPAKNNEKHAVNTNKSLSNLDHFIGFFSGSYLEKRKKELRENNVAAIKEKYAIKTPEQKNKK